MTPADPPAIERLRTLLEQAGAEYTIYRDEDNVATAADGVKQGFGELHDMAPTLILRCASGPVAAIIGGDRRLDFKRIKKHLGVKDVSLARPEQVREATGAEPGWVSLVNPGLRTLVDERLVRTGTACGGCGVPGYSLRIAVADLVRMSGAETVDITTARDPAR